MPRWPSGGNRRKLDELWLEKLERHGLSSLLPETPAEGPPQLYKAIDEFNGRLFWECHETLEDVWRNTPYPLRFFYHAIIKVAVGFTRNMAWRWSSCGKKPAGRDSPERRFGPGVDTSGPTIYVVR